jgi:TRAP-type C4-dicarboxylate transport system permease small subunit
MTTTTEGVSEFAVLAETMEARPGSRLMRPVEALSAVLLVAIIAMLLSGVAFRYGLSRPIVWIDEAASIAFLWLAMLGSAIAIDRCEHLRLTILLNALGERARQFTETLGMVAIMAFLLVLLPAAYTYAAGEMDITSSALNIPAGYRAAAIAVGMVLMVLLAVAQLLRTAKPLDVVVSVAFVLAVALVLWLLTPALSSFGNGNILIFLVGGAAVCLAMGVPIAFCFGIATLLFLAFTTSMPLVVMIGRMDEGMSSLILLSVPVFVLLGCILDATGMGKAIVDFLASMLGHVKAGMSYVLLGSLFLVSGISGSKVSDMATVAPALFPEMKRRGHKPKEMIALLATGAAMADTVPPSIVLIVLGSVAGVSIAALFTSGFAIALVLLVALAALARIKATRENVDGVARPSLKRVGGTALIAAPGPGAAVHHPQRRRERCGDRDRGLDHRGRLRLHHRHCPLWRHRHAANLQDAGRDRRDERCDPPDPRYRRGDGLGAHPDRIRLRAHRHDERPAGWMVHLHAGLDRPVHAARLRARRPPCDRAPGADHVSDRACDGDP